MQYIQFSPCRKVKFSLMFSGYLQGWIFFSHLLIPHGLSGAKMGNCILQEVLQQFAVMGIKPLPEAIFCWEQCSSLIMCSLLQ